MLEWVTFCNNLRTRKLHTRQSFHINLLIHMPNCGFGFFLTWIHSLGKANLQFTTAYCELRYLTEAKYLEEYHQNTNIQNIYKHSLYKMGYGMLIKVLMLLQNTTQWFNSFPKRIIYSRPSPNRFLAVFPEKPTFLPCPGNLHSYSKGMTEPSTHLFCLFFITRNKRIEK